jgi:hypothetical protein
MEAATGHRPSAIQAAAITRTSTASATTGISEKPPTTESAGGAKNGSSVATPLETGCYDQIDSHLSSTRASSSVIACRLSQSLACDIHPVSPRVA